jgi:hypothetical protein
VRELTWDMDLETSRPPRAGRRGPAAARRGDWQNGPTLRQVVAGTGHRPHS